MYIRTKDGRIAEVKENMAIKRCSENVLRLVYKDNQSICVLYGNDDIIAQSESLEELCDCFVKVWCNVEVNPEVLIYNEQYEEEKENILLVYPKGKIVIYGAIWTSKGLIYVAKTNEKGGLELI